MSILIISACLLLFPINGRTDILVLKDGKRIQVDKAWEENGLIKYSKYGSVIGYPKDKVKRIEKTKTIKNTDLNQFKFDHWFLGMTYDQVLHEAGKRHVHFKKKPQPASQRKQTAIDLAYSASLMNQPATVNLIFTPQSHKLAYIAIDWTGTYAANQKFGMQVEKALTLRHGAPFSKEAESVFSNVRWMENDRNQLILLCGLKRIELIYFDNRMHNLITEETPAIQPPVKAPPFNDLDKF